MSLFMYPVIFLICVLFFWYFYNKIIFYFLLLLSCCPVKTAFWYETNHLILRNWFAIHLSLLTTYTIFRTICCHIPTSLQHVAWYPQDCSFCIINRNTLVLHSLHPHYSKVATFTIVFFKMEQINVEKISHSWDHGTLSRAWPSTCA